MPTREQLRKGADQFRARSGLALGRPPARDLTRGVDQALHTPEAGQQDRPVGVVSGPAHPLPGGTPADVLARLGEHIDVSRALQQHIDRLMKQRRGPRVLETRTATIPANLPNGLGVWEAGRFRVPYASIAVLNPNQSAAQSVTVYGTQTNILGSTVIASIPNASLLAVAPLGSLWQVAWSLALRGTITTADAANMDLDSPVGTLKLKGMYPGAAGGPYAQTTLNIFPGTNGLSVVTPGAASSAAAIYDAEIVATPLGSQAAALIVSSAAAQGSPPGGGQGQFSVPAQAFVAQNLAGSALSVYGPAGALFSYCVMVDRVYPSAAKLV